MAHILIIEDEPNLRVLIGRLLTDAGHEVVAAANGTTGLQSALSESPDLVILDLVLPDLTGEEVLRVLLAAHPGVRVLVLSSVTEIDRRVRVLDAGAVDFVAKPFSNSELIARVRTRLRSEAPAPGPTESRFISGAGFELDMQRRELVMGDQRIELSQREFVLLAHLLHRRGEVCTRQELLADVWGIGFDPGTNVVDVYVRRLRNKLSIHSIETVRNVGYRLSAS